VQQQQQQQQQQERPTDLLQYCDSCDDREIGSVHTVQVQERFI
jgi:hypothetical protein